VRNDESALDIVQDAMLKLAEKYGDRPAEELPLLFQRILQNGIRDHFRRARVRSTWTTLLSGMIADPDDSRDPLESLHLPDAPGRIAGPEESVAQSVIMRIIEEEISRLPARQREAFVLRYWEDFDIAETAIAMGCSEGSVKTHCSRAAQALASALRERGLAP
jgi:RNA polymerase sigma-70 factor (ECF subfamily)